MRWMMRGCLCAGLVLAGCGREAGEAPVAASGPATQAVLPFAVSKGTTGVVTPLRGDGRPDYVGAANEAWRQGMKPEENGFVVYLRVVGSGVIPERPRGEVLQLCAAGEGLGMEPAWETFAAYRAAEATGPETNSGAGAVLEQAGQELWAPGKYPQLAAYLERYEKHLAGFVEMGERPVFWVPVVADESGALASYRGARPPLEAIVEIGRVFCARATLRAATEREDGFLRDIVVVENLAREMAGSPLLEDRMLAYELSARADAAVGAAVGQGKISAECCARLLDFLRILGPFPSPESDFNRGELWMALEAAERVAMGERGPEVWPGLDAGRVEWNRVLSGIQAEIRDAAGQARRAPLRDLLGAAPAEEAATQASLARAPDEAAEAYADRVRGALMARRRRGQPEKAAERVYRQSRLRDQLMAALVGMGEVRERLGRWPATIEEAPVAVRKLFLADPYAGDGTTLVRYRVIGGRARVYSVGPDGVDGGGAGDDVVVGF